MAGLVFAALLMPAAAQTLNSYTCVPSTCVWNLYKVNNGVVRVDVYGVCSNGHQPWAYARLWASNCAYPVCMYTSGGAITKSGVGGVGADGTITTVDDYYPFACDGVFYTEWDYVYCNGNTDKYTPPPQNCGF
jgi:hypothetical protein